MLRATFFEDNPILGESLRRFEASLAAYHGVEEAIGVGSGTSALVLTLRELGLAGQEVLTCSHTFAGVVSAILQAGAKPVLVEPDPLTGQIDLEKAAAAIGPETRALLAVHLYGHPVDLDAAARLCRDSELLLIEDVAQAHGARWRGRPVGSFGDAAVMSFHPSKNLGAFGDGGAVLTSRSDLAQGLRVARNLGKSGKYDFQRLGPNSKLDSLQAALLEVKLRHLDRWVARRRQLAEIYLEALKDVEGLELPVVDPRAEHAFHLFVVRTKRRDELRRRLAEEGIKTSLHYPIAAHRQPGLEAHLGAVEAPLAEDFASTVLTLPLSHEHRDDEIEAVAGTVKEILASPGQGTSP